MQTPTTDNTTLIEFVRHAPHLMALYGADGVVIAVSPRAGALAQQRNLSIGTLQDAAQSGVGFSTFTPLQEGHYTVASADPSPGLYGYGPLLNSILDSCPAAILVLNPEGRVLRWNPAAERMFGYTQEEVLGCVLPLVPASEMAEFEAHMKTMLEGRTITAVPLRRRGKDGALRDILLSAAPVKDSQGQVVATVAAYEDVTELNEMVRSLERTRAHLYQAQSLASMGSWVLDFTDDSLSWSTEVHRIHGTDPATFQPTRAAFRALVHPADLPTLVAAVEKAQRTGEPYAVEHRLTRPDGEIRHCRLSAAPLRDESGAVVKLIGIVQDVTEYKQLQEQFLQAQKLDTVGRLAGGVAHDFNNLLTIINGHAELLHMKSQAGSTERDSLEAIHEAGLRAASLTRQLLTLGRKQPAELRRIDLNQIVDEGGRVIQRLIGEDIELEIELDSSPLYVKADPGQIHQVLLNLAVNAREAMPKGGRMTIASRRLAGGAPSYVVEKNPRDCQWVEFSVADTGQGIGDDASRRLFEPFFTTKESARHSGLGLSTVYGVIVQHGGGVTFESALGRGATFRAALPLDCSASEAALPDATAGAPATGARVIVVEDQPAVRAVVCSMLDALGCAVEDFASPEGALIRVADPAEVDLLITDLVMPGMDGRELMRRARQHRPRLPVLFMSGYAEPPEDSTLARDPQSGFIAKPFNPKELAAKVAKLLTRPCAI
jgi:PAS domain S-box-containing protein